VICHLISARCIVLSCAIVTYQVSIYICTSPPCHIGTYLLVVGACATLMVKHWLGTWRSVSLRTTRYTKCRNDDTTTPSPRGYIAFKCCVVALDDVEGDCCSCGSPVAAGDGAFDSLIADQTRTTGRQQRAPALVRPLLCVRHASYSYTSTYVPGIIYCTYIPPKMYARKTQDISSRQQVVILWRISDSYITYFTSYRPIYHLISPYIGRYIPS